MAPSDERIPFRIGHGYDLHRLEPVSDDTSGTLVERPFRLCGIDLEHDRAPCGHSDGDAHAALLQSE